MSEPDVLCHLGILEKNLLVKIPIEVDGKGTAYITQAGREYVLNQKKNEGTIVSFPDGETEGGVDLVIMKLLGRNGEETEDNLTGAIRHNLSTTNRYITCGVKHSLLKREQVKMQDGVKITEFGRRYAEAKKLR